ncbi:MAG: phosphate ABC transporter substrate-binding protein PstS [Microbacteriaceae bacterium]|nr:phosphate ABC transporter substrate-binding protein PstS [Microbacteriaceae bacterium]
MSSKFLFRRGLGLAARRSAIIVAASLLVVGTVAAAAPAAQAQGASYYPISGGGSSWSSNALQQWTRNVWNNYRWKVVYNSDVGSSGGRQLFGQDNGGYDFAVSEIPYALKDGDNKDPRPARKLAYMPIVAGGTSFMYNLVIGGKKVTNLRLGGETLAKIFTGVITVWNDPMIAADNPKLALPATPIVPVVRSDGSGTTAQFSSWMRKQYPEIWNGYCQKAGRTNCGITSNYPVVSGSSFIGQSGSSGVAGYVSQPQYVGAITYVEYSYALNSRSPVAKILNSAGYYTEPTAANVAVGLLGAAINTDEASPDYLTQQLAGVYTNPDPRTYPLSSYSYMILPTALEYGFTENKGLTLAAFSNYFLCEGQQQAEVLGYSPLPINLVKAGLAQVLKIPGGDPSAVDINKCNNPTFSADGSNKLATSAAQPAACDKQGADQCATGTGGVKAQSTALASTGSAGGSSSSSAGGAAGGTGGAANGVAADGTPTDGTTADGTAGASSGSRVALLGSNLPAVVSGTPTTLPVAVTGWITTLATIVAAVVVALFVFLPSVIARRNSGRIRGFARARQRKRAFIMWWPSVNLRATRTTSASHQNATDGT